MNLPTLAPLGIALLGLVMGMRHATDPDHVIAVTTIVSRERRMGVAARIGIVWGLGHTLTVLAVGAAIIIFKLTIPARIGLAMEFAVAVVLILLGTTVTVQLAGRLFERCASRLGWLTPRGDSHAPGYAALADDTEPAVVHAHTHAHGGVEHWHPHAHAHLHFHEIEADYVAHRFEHDHALPMRALTAFAIRRPLLKSFGVGIVHGLAGSAAIALLVLGAIPQPLWATLYLVVFCLGTIIGMGLITTAIAAPFLIRSVSATGVHRLFVNGAALLSFGFGLLMAYQIGIVDGLFGPIVTWTPH